MAQTVLSAAANGPCVNCKRRDLSFTQQHRTSQNYDAVADFGVGLPSNVRFYFQNPAMSASDAMHAGI